MPTRFTSYLTFTVLITSFIGAPDLASAQSSDSSPQPIPGQKRADPQNVRNEFLSRLKDHLSVAHRKEAVINEYARRAEDLKALQQEMVQVQGEIESLESKWGKASSIPRDAANHVIRLGTRRQELSDSMSSNRVQMELLVEESAVLSRLEEVEREYKAKAISRVDYVSEERQLRQELLQLRMARQVDQLREGFTSGLVRIERKLESLTNSR